MTHYDFTLGPLLIGQPSMTIYCLCPWSTLAQEYMDEHMTDYTRFCGYSIALAKDELPNVVRHIEENGLIIAK